MSRAKSGASLDKEAGGTPPSRSRDPRSASLRRRRELDNINAQLTALKGRPRRHAGWISDDEWGHRARSAYERGARSVRPGVVEWDASGRCQHPVFRTLKGMPTDFWGSSVARDNQHPTRYLDMWVPCRRCRVCLWRKRWHWTQRGIIEMTECEKQGGRTWFVTLTFKPYMRSRLKLAAERRFGGQGWAELSSEQRSAALAKEAQPYVTLWMKRVRSQSGSALRYLLVTELHQDGMPHCHLLVHEQDPAKPLRHAVISRQWAGYGYSNAKLVDSDDPKAVEYATKYLSKNPVTRVRASAGYGHNHWENASSDIGQRPSQG